MPDKPFKQFERLAAALFGGKRHWANAGERVDFESDTAIGQCKLVKRMSMAEASELAEEMEREALPRGKIGVLCVKIRLGSGRKSPMLIVMTAAVYEAMNGKRSEQILVGKFVVPPDIEVPTDAVCRDCKKTYGEHYGDSCPP